MSGRGNREAALRADATGWRDRIIADAESAEGRDAARAHQVSVELVGEAAAMIEAYIARGADRDLFRIRGEMDRDPSAVN